MEKKSGCKCHENNKSGCKCHKNKKSKCKCHKNKKSEDSDKIKYYCNKLYVNSSFNDRKKVLNYIKKENEINYDGKDELNLNNI